MKYDVRMYEKSSYHTRFIIYMILIYFDVCVFVCRFFKTIPRVTYDHSDIDTNNVIYLYDTYENIKKYHHNFIIYTLYEKYHIKCKYYLDLIISYTLYIKIYEPASS